MAQKMVPKYKKQQHNTFVQTSTGAEEHNDTNQLTGKRNSPPSANQVGAGELEVFTPGIELRQCSTPEGLQLTIAGIFVLR